MRIISNNLKDALVIYKKDVNKFIEHIANLLGEYGDELIEWAKIQSKATLRKKIDSVINIVHDEWELSYALMEGTQKLPHNFKLSLKPKGSLKNNIPTKVIGEEANNLVYDISRHISSLLVTNMSKTIILYGKPLNGKSLIIQQVIKNVESECGFKAINLLLTNGTNNKSRFIIWDNANINMFGQMQIDKIADYIQNSEIEPILLITCSNYITVENLIDKFKAIKYEIGDYKIHELTNIILQYVITGDMYVKDFISKTLCHKLVNILVSFNSNNIISDAIDIIRYLIYPSIKNNISITERDLINAANKAKQLDIILPDQENIDMLKSQFTKKLIGQKQNVDKLISTLITVKSGMTDPAKPASSIFIYGPSGVGKTLTAKITADILFNGRIHKEDMSSYSEKHMASRLVGSPNGYIGYGEKTRLISFIERYENIGGVILFDEIEKAHPDVINHLMEMLDEGTFTASSGKVYNLRKFIIFNTSNIAFSSYSKKTMGFENKEKSRKNIIQEELYASLKKEYIGRIQLILKYEYLNNKDIENIAKLLLDQLSERLRNRNIKFKADKKTIKEVIGYYEKTTGAREMKSFVDTIINNRVCNLK